MIDRDKVIQGLQCCTQDHCGLKDCPYWEHGCEHRLKADALELLQMSPQLITGHIPDQALKRIRTLPRRHQGKRIPFILDGCDISFSAEAPADMTLVELLKQCDRIKPDWCACGIGSYDVELGYPQIELSFDYDDVQKIDEDAPCTIIPKETKNE